MKRALPFALGLLLMAGALHAAEWANIHPGDALQNDVRKQFGDPTKVSSQKLEGYDTTQWRYEGAQAPPGMIRVIVDFGLLTPKGYKADVVRSMFLEPRPGVFNRATILSGWGRPDSVEKEGDVDVFKYRNGLWVYFDKEGWLAEKMYFIYVTVPQTNPAQR